MTAKADIIAIESRFASNFTICYVKYANVPYTPTPGTAWADIHVSEADSSHAEIGGGLHRKFGIIAVNIYEPMNTGTANGKYKADLAAAVFRGQQFSGITCRSPRITEVGEVDEWYVINMTVSFYRDEIF